MRPKFKNRFPTNFGHWYCLTKPRISFWSKQNWGTRYDLKFSWIFLIFAIKILKNDFKKSGKSLGALSYLLGNRTAQKLNLCAENFFGTHTYGRTSWKPNTPPSVSDLRRCNNLVVSPGVNPNVNPYHPNSSKLVALKKTVIVYGCKRLPIVLVKINMTLVFLY